MTTTTQSAPTPDVWALARSLDVSATTPGHGIDILFSRFQMLRVAAAQHTPDVLASSSFATVIDAILERRANPRAEPFQILAVLGVVK